MIYKLTCTNNEVKPKIEARLGVNFNEDNTLYLRGASASSDLVTWSDPNYSFMVTLYTLIELNELENEDLKIESTDIEDTRPALEDLYPDLAPLMDIKEAFNNLKWEIVKDETGENASLICECGTKVTVLGIGVQFPILVFCADHLSGILFVENLAVLQDKLNFTTYNFETEHNRALLEGDLFKKYLTLVVQEINKSKLAEELLDQESLIQKSEIQED